MADYWGLVGRNPDDARVFIRITLDRFDEMIEGVDHRLYDRPIGVTMHMMVVPKGLREAVTDGFLPGEVAVCRPAAKDALSGPQIRALGRLARWHHNWRRQLCYHQLEWTEQHRKLTRAQQLEALPKELNPCPQNYVAGQRWLVEPVTESQLNSLQVLCRELNGARPWQMEAL